MVFLSFAAVTLPKSTTANKPQPKFTAGIKSLRATGAMTRLSFHDSGPRSSDIEQTAGCELGIQAVNG